MALKGRLASGAAFLALLSVYLLHGRSARADDSTFQALADAFRQQPGCSEGGISLGIVDHGKSSLMSFGTVQGPDGVAHPIRSDDRFKIGSITKTFTATLYASALQSGKVRPDQPAQSLMPPGVELPTYRTATGEVVPITLDELARHTSGLPRSIEGSGFGLSREDMTRQLPSEQLVSRPGSVFLYSNLGYAVLSMAMERVYDQDIETLLPSRIAAPLGMLDTSMDGGGSSSGSVVQGFRPNGAPAPEENRTWPAFDGASALRSTPSDMQQYLLYNMGLASSGSLDSLLPSLQHMERVQGGREGRTESIGLAWQGATLPDGRDLIWKNGNVPGFRSYIAFTNSQPQIGVVVLASQNGCKVMQLGRCVLESLDGHGNADRYCVRPAENAQPE